MLALAGSQRYLAGIVFIMLFVSLHVMSVEAQTAAEEISRVYSREAYSIIDEAPDEAYALAGIALEFDETNTDALHIRGAIDAREQETRARAIEYLERAEGNGDFSITSEREARLLLADLLIDSMRYEQALNVLEPRLHEEPYDPDALARQIRALRLSGRTDVATRLAEQGDRVYSDDPRFFGELVRLRDNPGRDAYRRLELRPLPDNQRWLSTVRYVAASTGDDNVRAEAVELYLENGGDDPQIYVYADSMNDEQRVGEFLEDGGARDLLLVQQMYERLSEEGRALLEEEFRGFTGTLEVDRRRRGLTEEVLTFSEGSLREWSIDSSVNGRPERVFTFTATDENGDSETRLEEAVHYGEDSTVTMRYIEYPELDYVDFGPERLHFRPGEVVRPMFERGSEWPQGNLNVFYDYGLEDPSQERLADVAIEKSSVIDQAYLLQEFEDRQVVRSARLDEGVRVLESSDTLHDGVVDKVSYYEDGSLRYTLEDPRGSGEFEVFREYARGVLSWTGYDTNGDGNYDFIESYEDGRMAEWDYDHDGIVDVRHYEFVDGTTRTQFLRFLSRPVRIRIDRVWTEPSSGL
ncbi:MAG: tetratricopeptide repeat protein [Spirochaetota bacterium]